MLAIVPKVHLLMLTNEVFYASELKNRYCTILKFSDYEDLIKTELQRLNIPETSESFLYAFILNMSNPLNYANCLHKEVQAILLNCKKTLDFRPLLITFQCALQVQIFLNLINTASGLEALQASQASQASETSQASDIKLFFSVAELNSEVPALPFQSKLFLN